MFLHSKAFRDVGRRQRDCMSCWFEAAHNKRGIGKRSFSRAELGWNVVCVHEERVLEPSLPYP